MTEHVYVLYTESCTAMCEDGYEINTRPGLLLFEGGGERVPFTSTVGYIREPVFAVTRAEDRSDGEPFGTARYHHRVIAVYDTEAAAEAHAETLRAGLDRWDQDDVDVCPVDLAPKLAETGGR
jgi:hypothetical protein